MAYVPVPKDLTRVKSKLIFNLTKRQVFCFGLGTLFGIPVFFLVKPTVGNSTAAMLMIAIMLPFFLFAMYEKNGQPLEVILLHFAQARFIRPKLRPYKTDNFYASIDKNVQLQREVNAILHGKRKRNGGRGAAETETHAG